MLENLTISNHGDYLLTEFCGIFSETAGKQCIDAMIAAALETNCRKVLLDCRKMTGAMPIMARFQVAVYAAKTRETISKIALLNRAEVILPDNFVENVAVNRGVNVKVHTDFDEALRWLLE
ncbi:MAG: hypothetical protein HY081_07440 [Gammaproteobacteria bacterium]|nr:hypothetical protein [Gammaproteobacteria bacterium]